MERLRLLMLEDNRLDAELSLAHLAAEAFECDVVRTEDEAGYRAALLEGPYDVILADFNLPDFSGAEALVIAREQAPDYPFIFVSGVMGEEFAVEMLKQGATDYVLKNRLQRLGAVVRRALKEARERRQRIEVERQLAKIEGHFRLVIDALRDYAVLTLDRQGNVRTWNHAAERIFGYQEADIVGRSAEIFFTPEDQRAGRLQWEMQQAVRQGSSNDDRWMQRADGTRFFASGALSSILDDDGELLGFSKIVRDQTAAWVAAENIRMAKEEAERANRTKDRFLAVLSHELRTPLTPILTCTHVLEMQGDLSPESRRLIGMIRRNVELEARLIDDLLDITSITQEKLSFDLQPVDLRALIATLIDNLGRDISGKQLTLVQDLPASRATVSADPARMQQIVWNLIKNAIKFTPPGGIVRVQLFNPDESSVALAVADTGIGISSEALPRIFSAFEQADGTITRQFGGLGLGLAIARNLAEKQGGKLVGESEGRGHGARFTLTMPLASEGEAVTPTPGRALSRGKGLQVLLLEDHPDTAQATTQLLELLGHTVSLGQSVSDARKLIAEGEYELLISDLALPDGDGLEVVRLFRSVSGAPAIALSGFGTQQDVERCMAAGFNQHLTKPVDLSQLLGTIRELHKREG